MKDFTIELTTHKKIKEVNGAMCHNFYYVQHGRIYNADHTRFRRFKFVVWFDIFDVCEYFEKDTITTREIAECASEVAWLCCEGNSYLIKSYDDCLAFYDWCNATINDYNRTS
jgi:hypothetical protein